MSLHSSPQAKRPPNVRFTYDAVTRGTMKLAIKLAFLIGIPAFILGFLGAYIDKAMNTKPEMMFFGFFCAMCISGYLVVRKVRAFVKAQNAPSSPQN